MISHIVLYAVHPENPNAAQQIVDRATELLGPIAVELKAVFHAAVIPPPTRVVSGTIYQVVLNFVFPDTMACDEYMKHPLHMQFVRFVLHGWKLPGSTAADPGEEFIQYLLKAPAGATRIRPVRNLAISKDEVVWSDEMVVDA